MKFGLSDTIAAISTPIGQAGIGIVRISGKDSLKIADRIFLSKDGKRPSEFKTYTTHYGWIVKDQRLEIIDEVILTVMCRPKSYTKEDVVEINCHGGIVPLRKTLELVLENGARLAERGEFTKRAFLNGRIDLSQAEAVLDIVRARTDKALEVGLRQLKGELLSKINGIRQKLIEILAYLEADIDFPQEDIRIISGDEILERLNFLMKELEGLILSSEKGKIFREGVSLVICGKPNVGKSLLLNRLLKEEKAIVTSIAGTTRDTIEEIVDIEGIPFKITDTAGILEPKDLIEREAVKRSRRAIEEADLVLIVFDGSRSISGEDRFLLRKIKRKNFVPVINKIDLKQKIDLERLNLNGFIKISALKRKGLERLEEEIVKKVWRGEVGSSEEILVSNIRHTDSLKRALKTLERTEKDILRGLSDEFLAIDLKEAIDCLGEITGDTLLGEDLLDKIFSEFCIGK